MPALAAVPATTLSRAVADTVVRQAPADVAGRAKRGGDWLGQAPREDRLVATWWSMKPIYTLPPHEQRRILDCLGSGLPWLVRSALWQDWPGLIAAGATAVGRDQAPRPVRTARPAARRRRVTAVGAGPGAPPGDPTRR